MLASLEALIAAGLRSLSDTGVALRVGPGPEPADGPALTIIADRWRALHDDPTAAPRATLRLRLVAWARAPAAADELIEEALALLPAALEPARCLARARAGGMCEIKLINLIYEIVQERRGYHAERRMCWSEVRVRGDGQLDRTALEVPDTRAPSADEAAPAAPIIEVAPAAPPPRRSGPRPLEQLAPLRLKALGDTSAKHLTTLFQIGTLEGLAGLTDAQLDASGLSATARSTLRSGRAQAAVLLALELDPWVPIGLADRPLTALAALSEVDRMASALAAGGVDGDGLRAGLTAMQDAIQVMIASLDSAWFASSEATLAMLVRGA